MDHWREADKRNAKTWDPGRDEVARRQVSSMLRSVKAPRFSESSAARRIDQKRNVCKTHLLSLEARITGGRPGLADYSLRSVNAATADRMRKRLGS